MSFIVRHDSADLGRKLQATARRYPRAAVSGINRTAQRVQTMAVREIRLNVGASSQKTIRRNIRLQKATPQKLRAELVARSGKKERIPIIELKPRPKTVSSGRQRGPGVSFGPRKKLIPGSFVQRMKSGHVGVFIRTGDFGRSGDFSSEKIAEARGPSVALVLRRKPIVNKIRAFIKEHLPIEMARAIRFATKV